MTGIPWYHRVVLGMTVGFLLLTGGRFLAQSRWTGAYSVVTERAGVTETRSVSAEAAEESWPDSLLPGERIGLNTAEEKDLKRLPGIGEKGAKAIVEYRKEHGPFRSVEELLQVSGIGPGKLAGLREYVTVD